MNSTLFDATGSDTCCRQMRAEYSELPSLCLTPAQARRLWHLDEAACQKALDALVLIGVLRFTADGQYCRADYEPLRADE